SVPDPLPPVVVTGGAVVVEADFEPLPATTTTTTTITTAATIAAATRRRRFRCTTTGCRKHQSLGSGGMALLQSRVERTDDFVRRRERMQTLVDELRARTAQVA